MNFVECNPATAATVTAAAVTVAAGTPDGSCHNCGLVHGDHGFSSCEEGVSEGRG
jgi:hypothetical protein